MARLHHPLCVAVVVVAIACATVAAPAPASANPICTAAGLLSGIAGKACTGVTKVGKIVGVGKKLLGGHVGAAIKKIIGTGGSTASGAGSTASTAVGLAAIGAWVAGGAKFALHETSAMLGQTTSPQLRSTWFSSTYWKMTAIAAVLTLPFLFAAAIQALLRSDLTLLVRAALGYLPLAMLAVSIAAPLTMLLLSASDGMSAFVSSAAGRAGAGLLAKGGAALGALTVISGSPFIAFLVGAFTAGAALVLWLELLMREAAVYVIVLLLPLVFAAFVWPARRVWALRAVELLVALILSKFAIVAVLSLGGAALAGSGLHTVAGSLAGIVLLSMGAFAPWALIRLVPLAELASGAAGALRSEGRAGIRPPAQLAAGAGEWADLRWGHDWPGWTISGMRRQADEGAGADRSLASHPDLSRGLRSPGGDDGGAPGADPGPAGGGGGAPSADPGPSGGGEGAGGARSGDRSPADAGAGAAPGNGDSSPVPTDPGHDPVHDPVPSTAGAAEEQSPNRGGNVDERSPLGEAPPAAAARAESPSPTERVPGLGAIWQAPNGSWGPVVVGMGKTWPPRLRWPSESSDGGAPTTEPSDHSPASDPADDHDPRPPAQAPEDGHL